MKSTRGFPISIGANGRPIVVIDDFFVVNNEVTILFGESGIGKSLLCKALYGQLDHLSLDVTLDNKPYTQYRTNRHTHQIRANSFFVFQEPSSHLNPLVKIKQQLCEGDLTSGNNEQEILAKLWENEPESKINAILDLYPKPYRPSGGEKQRILLAMAFKKISAWCSGPDASGPTFFVFDEPTGSLDNHYRDIFLMMLLAEFAKKNFTAVVITHDYSIISRIYEHHAAMIDRVHFRELRRTGEATVSLFDFSAQEYLGWLKQKLEPGATDPTEVLRCGSTFCVFGRRLRLSRDKERRMETALTIKRGEMVYVKAPSGTGKTTLAKMILGLYKADECDVTLDQTHLTQATPSSTWHSLWGKVAGMVFQHADEALDAEATVFGTFRGLPGMGNLSRARIRDLLKDLFDESQLTDRFLDKKVKYLSGGQKQRLNILRSLALSPQIVILDEPLNGLDFAGCLRVLDLLAARQRQGCSFLVISHNEEIFDHLVPTQRVWYLDVDSNR